MGYRSGSVVVNFSFGEGSFCAAERMVREFGKDKVHLIFADTKYEDEDTYAWGRAAAEYLGCTLHEVADGRDVWQVFEDESFIGSSQADPCSKILKRKAIDRYMEERFIKSRTLVAFGIHWSEYDRFFRIDKDTGERKGVWARLTAKGWPNVRAPMCEKPFVSMEDMKETVKRAGLWEQKLYRLGFPHANCGGRCCKQGQKGWALLYKTMPERFIECRDKEIALRAKFGDYAMLKETVNGERFPLPLFKLQERLDAGKECDEDGFGGCGCFTAEDDDLEVAIT